MPVCSFLVRHSFTLSFRSVARRRSDGGSERGFELFQKYTARYGCIAPRRIFFITMTFFIQNIFIFFVIVAALVCALAAHAFFLHARIRAIFKDEKGMSLDKVMERLLARTAGLEQETALHARELKRIREDFMYSIQKIEYMRFNSFEEAGGQQSFTIALLDAHHSGLIFTHLQLRDAGRLYVKPIQNGKAAQKLSHEEEETLNKAINAHVNDYTK